MTDDDAPHPRGLFAWLWRRYLWPRWPLLAAAMVFMVIEGSTLGLLSWMMKPMFDRIFVGGEAEAIPWVALAFFGIFAVRGLASVAHRVLLTRLSELSAAQIRADLVGHLMRLDGSFHQSHPPGYLMQRIEGDVNSINKVWRTILTGAGRDLVAVVALFSVALGVDWVWTLIACVGAPILLAPLILLQRYVRRQARRARDVAAGLSTRLNEIFLGIVPVKLNTLEEYQAARYARLTRERVRTQTRSAAGQAMIPGLIDIMSGLGFMGVLFYGGAEIIAGEKTVGDFMSFFAAMGLAFDPVRRLGNISGVWQVAAAGIERIKELLSTEPALTSPAHPAQRPQGVPEIVLEEVYLDYGDAAALRGASFTAEAGRKTALVGPSGAGKSSVFNLLTRLADPQSGRVTVGGVPVQDLDLGDLRRLFSVVSQDALLFDETLRENILLGRKDVADDRLQEVLDAAHVTDFLPRLSRGLDTPVGPRGSNLSGGQRQRVAIARALLRDTPVLLLDEATSALDTQSERMVQEALERLSEGRTTLVIAHRLSTVRDADRIVVMDEGRVVETGRHEDLLARGGVYADLHRLQIEDPEGGPA
ncbi:ABC transporter ATP-binding protein [Rhodosalinus halophilus]|uniref:ABC transporter ATP-binding protein n=1 Tax=Rhodosalinus halophilus TaxID=2259333 RepID=A0A365UDJ3_9RHOB|nr:ABC transporter ATP-binding protein [Rhodosalinus halophilus]RBI87616.1 ABC transporter ATP-binding protein [Rhodosalinus halophilus]